MCSQGSSVRHTCNDGTKAAILYEFIHPLPSPQRGENKTLKVESSFICTYLMSINVCVWYCLCDIHFYSLGTACLENLRLRKLIMEFVPLTKTRRAHA